MKRLNWRGRVAIWYVLHYAGVERPTPNDITSDDVLFAADRLDEVAKQVNAGKHTIGVIKAVAAEISAAQGKAKASAEIEVCAK